MGPVAGPSALQAGALSTVKSTRHACFLPGGGVPVQDCRWPDLCQVGRQFAPPQTPSGAPNAGQVTLQSLGGDRTRIELRLDYEPRGAIEAIGGALGVVNMQAGGSLRRFKSQLEQRGGETGAWRGSVSNGHSAPV